MVYPVKIGVVTSSFDILHPGYLRLLKQTATHCNYLIVMLHRDPSIERPSTKTKPLLPVVERRLALESNRFVNEVREYDTEAELHEMLKDVLAENHSMKSNGMEHSIEFIRFLGDDYKGKETFTGSDLPYEIIWIDRSHGWSMTKFRDMIIESGRPTAKERLKAEMERLGMIYCVTWETGLDRVLWDRMNHDPATDRPYKDVFLSNLEISNLYELSQKCEGGWWRYNTTNAKPELVTALEWQNILKAEV